MLHKTPTSDYGVWVVALHRDLLSEIRRLDSFDLRRLMVFAGALLAGREGPQPGPFPRTEAPRTSYRQQMVRCGKRGCSTCPHGPYWYAYWREGGRVRSRYVGKERPPEAAPWLAH